MREIGEGSKPAEFFSRLGRLARRLGAMSCLYGHVRGVGAGEVSGDLSQVVVVGVRELP
jgi:hypothetical protein